MSLVKQPELVIFDKDGTLLDNYTFYNEWAFRLVSRLKQIFPELLYGDIWSHLGLDIDKRTANANSVIHWGTHDDIREKIVDFIIDKRHIENKTSIYFSLLKRQEEREKITKQLQEEWNYPKTTSNNIQTTCDLVKLFGYLKERNIKIAICTSDTRKSVLEMIYCLKLEKYIDAIVCGDDNIEPKPSPRPIISICISLDIPPSEAIMLGDTMADIGSARSAGCSFIIGIKQNKHTSDSNLVGCDIIKENIECLYNLIN
tara:strand:+ start:794 stop:1567 length:774 start_codon:yes stop_codon:yes gene_type:complete